MLDGDGELQRRLLDSLPFRLTGAQQRVLAQIREDDWRNRIRHCAWCRVTSVRKTVVAALAAPVLRRGRCQVALMAPTELLAEQHLRNFAAWLDPLGVAIGWLSGRHKGVPSATTLQALGDGELKVVIGTHALFQDDVLFDRLRLVIVDEQHRFGVHQRLALREKVWPVRCPTSW